MKIFTERGFREELERRRVAQEEADYERRRFFELEEKVECLYRIVEDLRLGLAERKES